MKAVFLITLLSLGILSAEDIRAYRVEIDLLRQVAPASESDPFADGAVETPNDYDLSGPDWLGPVVKKAGFESRFLKEAGELRDCSKRVKAILGEDEALQAEAVFDVSKSRLIVKGNEGGHQVLRFAIRENRIEMIKTTLALYEVPGVGREDRTGFWDEVPKEATLVKELSWLGISGATHVLNRGKGEMEVESEFQWDAYEGYLESRLSIEVANGGGGFSYRATFYGIAGPKWAQEVGTLDGEKALMLVSQSDPVFPDGRRWAEWIEKEEGGFFLEEERLQGLRWKDPTVFSGKVGPDQSTAMFSVPPRFMTFLDGASGDSNDPNDDPFAVNDSDDQDRDKVSRKSVRQLLEENGITFREGDSVKYLRGSNTLIAKLSPENLELLDGIVNARVGLGPPEYSYVELTKVEGDDLASPILKRMVLPFRFGETTEMTLGKDLAVQVETIMGADLLGEVRLKISETAKDLEHPDYQGGFAFRVGRPVLFQSETSDGVKTSWFMTVRNKVLEREIDALLKKREE